MERSRYRKKCIDSAIYGLCCAATSAALALAFDAVQNSNWQQRQVEAATGMGDRSDKAIDERVSLRDK
ncbi:hypothetical protein [cf. Phormidesmis sp. LEGE 11477]|uniref:hypothetical protein n=1 Tax=cf. Phormidesmis sp. LEGE 11477 TaxID=1828680 RepID=UPI00188208FD|nr:hypothetical protein [cf. Phormidesmis sp. LEGE 11477]MBE9064044.1 hypothetical protein [cf. Phormidesmis sp. LEGE 11477]